MERRDFLKYLTALIGGLFTDTLWDSTMKNEAFASTPGEIEVLEKGKVITRKRVVQPDSQWKKVLPDRVYEITREKGTERPFSGKYNKFYEKGVYRCAACDNELFSSKDKFDSGTGWPSYTRPIDSRNIREKSDNSFFMKRTEVLCSVCDSHLGHVFNDGPPPAGLRYCINSLALKFEPR